MIPLMRRVCATVALMTTLLSVPPPGVVIVCAQLTGSVELELSSVSVAPSDPAACRCHNECGPCRDTVIGLEESPTRALCARADDGGSLSVLPCSTIGEQVLWARSTSAAIRKPEAPPPLASRRKSPILLI